MNVLIIGNGFDLAHKLPTSYHDFLKDMTNNKHSHNNKWLEYFISKMEMNSIVGENWIDLEKEIKNTLNHIIETPLVNVRNSRRKELNEHTKIMDIMADANIQSTLKDKKKYINILVRNLNDLEELLEEYMSRVDNMTIGDISQDIIDIKADKVLSFNYTNTYSRIYDNTSKSKCDYCYIHGRVGEKNLILGYQKEKFDEYDAINMLDVRFRKYYQRILKETGSVYKEWLKEHNIDIYFFGFSLAQSDGDVIKEIMLAPTVNRITVFYHSDESHAQLIENAVRILGEDEVIELVYNKKLIFKKQKIFIPR